MLPLFGMFQLLFRALRENLTDAMLGVNGDALHVEIIEHRSCKTPKLEGVWCTG
jgi:hypothetical protein